MTAPARMSTRVFRLVLQRGNSSGITVMVAPAALPTPRARCPALRPMATTKYQREVVLASAIRFFTSSTPMWRAVWYPKVSTMGSRSRSLSMVLGTWTTRILPAARSETFIAENAVSSPPMVMSWVTPSRCKESTTATMSSSFLVGFAREVPRIDPPEKWMLLTSPSLSGLMSSSLLLMRRSKPSRMPSTSTPCRSARIVAALITLLMPGAGPPPTRIPSFSLDTLNNSLRANPSIVGPCGCNVDDGWAMGWCWRVRRLFVY